MRSVSRETRDILIEHIDGPCQVIACGDHAACARLNRVRGLVSHGLLRWDRPMRPRSSHITDQGRAALAKALADWADALTRTQIIIDHLRPAHSPAESGEAQKDAVESQDHTPVSGNGDFR
jgi:hypothetical protein